MVSCPPYVFTPVHHFNFKYYLRSIQVAIVQHSSDFCPRKRISQFIELRLPSHKVHIEKVTIIYKMLQEGTPRNEIFETVSAQGRKSDYIPWHQDSVRN